MVRECVSPEESADWLLNLRMGPEGRSCATGGRVTGALLATLEAKLGARTHKGAILSSLQWLSLAPSPLSSLGLCSRGVLAVSEVLVLFF